jgi:cytoskeletal protein RodZ
MIFRIGFVRLSLIMAFLAGLGILIGLGLSGQLFNQPSSSSEVLGVESTADIVTSPAESGPNVLTTESETQPRPPVDQPVNPPNSSSQTPAETNTG